MSYYTLITALPWLPELEQCKQMPLSRIALDQRLTMLLDSDQEQFSLVEALYFPDSDILQVYLQQDAFDDVDISVPIKRQQENFELLRQCLLQAPEFSTKDQVRDHFVKLTGLFKNLNYSRSDSPDYKRYIQEIKTLSRV